jgi:hypothetical protein
MKKVWKWVIGIAVALVVLAALVGGAFLLRSHFANVASLRVARPGLQIPGNGWDDRRGDGNNPGMMPFGNYGWGRGMHLRGFGMMGFGGMGLFGGLIGGLFSLGILALVVLGVIWLVGRLRKPKVVAATVEPVASAAPVAAVMADTHPCPRCGEPVHEDWKHCPNCGKKQ